MVALHTVIAIALIIGLIIWLKVNPVISLVLGSLYLGLAAGVGFAGTAEAIVGGFGEIMAEVGLLIGFGVLIGSLLHALGAFRKLVRLLLRVFGARRIPYAMTAALATVFPSIYVDVQVVLAAPVARSSAPHLGERGLPHMAGAIGIGIFSGYVFMVPGLAAVSAAGLLGVDLGLWLAFGVVLGPLTAVLTTLIFRALLRTGFWNPAKDEEPDRAVEAVEDGVTGDVADDLEAMPPLGISVLPIVVPLLLIALNAFVGLATDDPPALIAFLGDPTIALFLGLLGAYALARGRIGAERSEEALKEGFHTSGEILLVTGIGGSLGAVIDASGLGDQLGGLFSAEAGAPVVVSILLAWFIAALLHAAIGSVSVAAITAGGIIGPVLDQIAVAPVAIGLAIASGALFALQVNSNFFWMFRSLLGLSTQGTLKSLTVVTSIGSLVSLPMVMAIGLVA